VAIGSHFIAADHGALTRADVVELVTSRLFAQDDRLPQARERHR